MKAVLTLIYLSDTENMSGLKFFGLKLKFVSQRVREAPLKSDKRSDDGADSGVRREEVVIIMVMVVTMIMVLVLGELAVVGILIWFNCLLALDSISYQKTRKMGSLEFYGFQSTEVHNILRIHMAPGQSNSLGKYKFIKLVLRSNL